MQIRGPDYEIMYDLDTATLTFRGVLRLNRIEYAPIVRLLSGVAGIKPALITVDLQELKFLNSSGVSVVSKFVIQVRKLKVSQILVLGSKKVSWQRKSLKNLQKLMRGIQVEWVG